MDFGNARQIFVGQFLFLSTNPDFVYQYYSITPKASTGHEVQGKERVWLGRTYYIWHLARNNFDYKVTFFYCLGEYRKCMKCGYVLKYCIYALCQKSLSLNSYDKTASKLVIVSVSN